MLQFKEGKDQIQSR